MRIAIIICITLLPLLKSFSQTHVSGSVSGKWTRMQSPILVDGNITISLNDSLIIEPGVNIIFQGFYKFEIKGKIQANGIINDSIKFTVRDTNGFNSDLPIGAWNGIFLIESQANHIFQHCIFEYAKDAEDIRGSGSAIRIEGFRGETLISYSTFRNNRGGSTGGAIACGAEGNDGFTLQIDHCKFNNNSASSGGAIYVANWGVPLYVNHCDFIENTADYGGSITSQGGLFSNCLFKNNTADNGAAIYNMGGGINRSINCIFDSNKANNGAIFYSRFSIGESGIYNCTFIRNEAGTSVLKLDDDLHYDLRIANSIFWNVNSPEFEVEVPFDSLFIEACIFKNSSDSIWFSESCIDSDPLLKLDGYNKYSPNYNSPCIDNGNNDLIYNNDAFDFLNRERIIDGNNDAVRTVDIGAIEYNSIYDTGIYGKTIKNNESIKCQVSPNPSNKEISFTLSEEINEECNLYIYNEIGRLVYKQNISINQTGLRNITVNNLKIPVGLYYYTLVTKNNHISGKIHRD